MRPRLLATTYTPQPPIHPSSKQLQAATSESGAAVGRWLAQVLEVAQCLEEGEAGGALLEASVRGALASLQADMWRRVGCPSPVQVLLPSNGLH
jgi:hypothetical protein